MEFDEHVKEWRCWRREWALETMIMPWADYLMMMIPSNEGR